MKRKLLGQPRITTFVLIAISVVAVGLVTNDSHPVQAAQSGTKQTTQTQPVNASWEKEIAAHRTAARLNPAMMARINRAIAARNRRLTSQERRNFIAGVQAMQAKLRTGGFTAAQHDHFVHVLRQRGVSAKVAEQLFNDPIALLTIPVNSVTTTTNTSVAESTLMSTATVTQSGIASPHNTCGNIKSTSPYITVSGYALGGNRLDTIRFIKVWCWKKTIRPIPYLPTVTITSAPQWEPPQYSTTNFCIGCELTIDWHSQYWYFYSPPYPLLCNTRCNFVSKVHFHIRQCFGIGPLVQCLSPHYYNWALSLHADGTFHAQS